MGVTDDTKGRPELDGVRLATDDDPWFVEITPSTASTNADLAERARQGAPEGLVIATEHQTAGRGRLDRSWEAPPGSALTFSVLLRPDWPADRWPWLPLLTGIAVRNALQEYVAAGLKWPNDVLVGDKKICGILLERVDTPDGPAAIVGIGLNTGMTAEELPVDTATSLLLETGEQPDRTGVLIDVLRALFGLYRDADPAALHEDYTNASVTLGRQVHVELPGGEVIEGRAESIDEHGRLLVAHAGGTTVVGAGDVVHARLSPGHPSV